MITIRGIKKSFGDLAVIRGVDLDVQDGEVLAILGPSGSGKTTFLRTINFLGPADEGTIQIDDVKVDCATATKQEIRNLRKKTAMVFQNYNLFKNMTALENVMEGLTLVQKMDKGRRSESFYCGIRSCRSRYRGGHPGMRLPAAPGRGL